MNTDVCGDHRPDTAASCRCVSQWLWLNTARVTTCVHSFIHWYSHCCRCLPRLCCLRNELRNLIDELSQMTVHQTSTARPISLMQFLLLLLLLVWWTLCGQQTNVYFLFDIYLNTEQWSDLIWTAVCPESWLLLYTDYKSLSIHPSVCLLSVCPSVCLSVWWSASLPTVDLYIFLTVLRCSIFVARKCSVSDDTAECYVNLTVWHNVIYCCYCTHDDDDDDDYDYDYDYDDGGGGDGVVSCLASTVLSVHGDSDNNDDNAVWWQVLVVLCVHSRHVDVVILLIKTGNNDINQWVLSVYYTRSLNCHNCCTHHSCAHK